MQLDEVTPLSGDTAGLPVVLEEEEDEEPPNRSPSHTNRQHATPSCNDPPEEKANPQHDRLSPTQLIGATQGSQHQPPRQEAECVTQQEMQARVLLQPRQAPDQGHSHRGEGLSKHQQLQENKPSQSHRHEIPTQSWQQGLDWSQANAAQASRQQRLQEPAQQQPKGFGDQALRERQCHNRQPTSPQQSRDPVGHSAPQQHAASPWRAAAKAPPAKKTSPLTARAVEHSSLSLSQLSVANRSKLRLPSNVHSPPNRSGRALLPKHATNSHLVKLAAAVPLPASPVGGGGGDSHGCALDATAPVALATAVAKPSHIPAPAGKPSRLKKPANTSGFFSSGRSFTGAANTR